MAALPPDIGILDAEIYFPLLYVDQKELEAHDGCPGKYTIGLGQSRMSVATDAEDVVSQALTVTHRLLRRVDSASVGFLEVGTESMIDKSKSVKTHLMTLFGDNDSIEGVDVVNACFSGTQALFHALNWLESSSCCGRLALVVMSDIAVYSGGGARPTGGAGAVALLLGPHAPLVVETGCRAIHMSHNYDFYKPVFGSEYPLVDGPLSLACYLRALERCYSRYSTLASSSLDNFAACLFHAPFSKLVQKSFARLFLLEQRATPDAAPTELGPQLTVPLESLDQDKTLEKRLLDLSRPLFEEKTSPSLLVSRNCGNMYSPSLYGGLLSFLAQADSNSLAGQRLLLFSYGSGSAGAMFSLRVTTSHSQLDPLLSRLHDLPARLAERQQISVSEFEEIMAVREAALGQHPYTPQLTQHPRHSDAFYLSSIDAKFRRVYHLHSGEQLSNGH